MRLSVAVLPGAVGVPSTTSYEAAVDETVSENLSMIA